MVDIRFKRKRDESEVKEFLDSVQWATNIPRGPTASDPFDLNGETLEVDLDDLKIVLYEHRLMQESKQYSPSKIEILRILQDGPETMGLGRLQEELDKHRGEEDSLAKSTISEYLSQLIEEGLVVKERRGRYAYAGP